jgi:hypothetical protein
MTSTDRSQRQTHQITGRHFDLVLLLVKDDVKKMIQRIESSRFHENPRDAMKETTAGRYYAMLMQLYMTPPQSKYNNSWTEMNVIVSRSTVPDAEW